MGVGFHVGYDYYEVGHSSFLYSFFSSIAYHLEHKQWGSRFPVIMRELYDGKLNPQNVDQAIAELKTIQEELKEFRPDQVIWDFEDLSAQPPWGDRISSEITDLSNYYVTSDGKDLISVLFEALEQTKRVNQRCGKPIPLEVM